MFIDGSCSVTAQVGASSMVADAGLPVFALLVIRDTFSCVSLGKKS